MPITTRVTKMLGIEHPIVMGGMTGTGTPELAAAVSNAGGLGLFAVLNAGSPERCREWIKKMHTLTSTLGCQFDYSSCSQSSTLRRVRSSNH